VQQQFMEEIQQKNATISIEFNVKDIYYPKIYLESILSNLLSNALRFTAKDRAPRIEIHTHLEQEGTLLTVKDNGLGINLPKYKSELFMFKKVFHRGFETKGVGLFSLDIRSNHWVERSMYKVKSIRVVPFMSNF
jgi:C4-dicarboxylate-specific signal transduction histidine kinase